ncbi:aromatic ring-hydroxylating oxygenase subunit alpha [Nocardia mexicana]|uniref:Rieske 2Fe-2S family protein/choline monooxygenase n=1 Tax=Nocardia mexicana TaxID=279262 RepID=A0A370GRT1_9NOCA|nr:aromatic ring-hydroxylating dioxygenase subunit alpha [Nocardia mexicana]RDI46418.1 Rieske 2Fe-2S family protein/choline monooxygenase [Nocardia mexicana]
MPHKVNQLAGGVGSIDPEEVDRLLGRRHALPSAFYHDPELHRLEKRLLLNRAWQAVGIVGELRDPGDYLTTDVAGVPVVVLRGRDDTLRAFVNVCRHRANVIATGSGNCRSLQCAYHGWTYSLDGSLKGIPHRDQGDLPPADTLGLRPVAVDVFGGIVFVCLEPQESLLDQLGDMPDMMARAGYDFPFAAADGGPTPLTTGTEDRADVRANWKLVVDNANECYHCPTIHPQTICAVTGADFDYELNTRGKFGMVVGQHLTAKWQAKFPAGKSGSQYGYAQYTLWPNTIVVSGYVGEHILRLEPTGPGTTRTVARTYLRPDLPAGPVGEMNAVLFGQGVDEDIEVMERVQRGLESGYYEPGPLMNGPEGVIHAFQKQVWDALRPAFRED